VTPATYAALQSAITGTAYIAYTPMLIVTGAVAVAGLRLHVVPLWLAVLSALITLVMAAATFLPFVNWFPALVWILVVSIAMLMAPRTLPHARLS
jgi:hypothetical protein